MSFLTIENIEFNYGETKVLRQVSLEINKGELVSLIGPSGCGKTTLLRLIAGFEKPHFGEIKYQDTVISSPQNIQSPSLRRFGVVFQDYSLFPHLSVRQNIQFGLHELTEEVRQSRLSELSQLLGLDEHLDKLPSQLSGGQQQRVALARTLAPRPEVVLFDEPFSNLDAHLKKHLAQEIRALLHRFQITGILVTHDLEDSLAISDKLALMKKGVILQWGAPKAIYNNPHSLEVASFISKGTLVEVEESEDHEIHHPDLGALPKVQGPQKEMKLWLKPTDLTLDIHGSGFEVEDVLFQGQTQLVILKSSTQNQWEVLIDNSISIEKGDVLGVNFKPELFVF